MPPRVTWSSSTSRPSRIATAAESSGSPLTSPTMVPGVTSSPERGSLSATRYGGSSAGCVVTGISGSVTRTATIRLAPTSARVNLSAASTAVRIGMTRKKAYP